MAKMDDHRRADRSVDWDAWSKANVADGSQCRQCSAYLWSGQGVPCLCRLCELFRDERGPVMHDALVRCPRCSHAFGPAADGRVRGGECEVECPECDESFTVDVTYEVRFESPALGTGGDDDDEVG